MSGFVNFLGPLLNAAIKAFTTSRDQEMQDAGQTEQKAKQDSGEVQNSIAARSSDDAVDRMSDTDVRNSELGAFRD